MLNQKFTSYSGKNSPCPICGRTKDGDCRWRSDFILCHTYIDEDVGILDYKYCGPTGDGRWGQYAYFQRSSSASGYYKSIRSKGRREFIYTSREGEPLVRVQRNDDGEGGKQFYQSSWDGKDWRLGLSDNAKKQVPIYRYREVQNAISKGQLVIVVEGESCADRLWKSGIAATTTLGGSSGYRKYGNYSKDLQDASLVLCPDCDQPGIKYMEAIAKDFPDAKWLYPFTYNSFVWQQIPPKNGVDVVDWIDQGASAEEILAAIGPRCHEGLVTEIHDASDSAQTKLALTFEELMHRITKIRQIDDEARQDWEGIRLASSIRGFSWNQLKSMHQKAQEQGVDFRPIDVQEFLKLGPKEREWLINGHISKATTSVLFADGGVGKTLLAYDLCKAIALGQPWNGFRVNQGKVLIIQTDEPEIDTRERLNIAGFKDIPVGWIHIQSHWQFSQLPKLEKWIEAERPAFVMIDSLTSANRNAVAGSEWDASYAASLYNLRDIANTYGCSIMILHHENKAGGARGTTAIRNNVSEVWRLRKGTDKEALKPTQRILEIEKSRSGCNGTFQIELNLDNFSWTHQGDFGEGEGGPLPLSARIISYLEARPGIRFEPEELLSEFPGSSKDAIRKQLERLRRRGLVESEERKKTHETGACRYKVYFVERQNNIEEGKQPLEDLSSVNGSKTYHDVQTLDGSNSLIVDVQRPKLLDDNDLVHAGQVDSVVQPIYSPQNLASHNPQIGSIQCGDRVYYRGSASGLRNLCREKMLDVLNVKEGVAECTFSTWIVTQKIPISDLQKVSTSEEQG